MNTYSDLFVLMQICLGLTQNKEKMINTIAHTIGIFDETVQKDKIIYFIFIHFISTLIFDRLEINDNKTEKLNQKLITKLLFRQKLFNSFKEIFQFEGITYLKKIKNHLDTISTSSPSPNGVTFKLKSRTLWDPLAPIYESNQILSIYSKYISKYPNELMPFKPFTEEPFGMDLHSCLNAPTLLAIEYYILLNKYSQETNQLIINLLLTTSKFYSKKSNKNLENIIIVKNIEELITKIPNDFESLMYQKYQLQNYSPKSFVDLISELGPIGQNALMQMNISYEIPKTNETKTTNNKLKDLKSSILQSFNNKMEQFEKDNNFDFDESDSAEDNEQCSACRTNDNEILCYPLYMYNSTIPLEYDNYGTIEQIKCFTLCTHLVHKKCLHDICPVDRYLRNICLPKLDNRNDLKNENVFKAVNDFEKYFVNTNQIFISFCSIFIIYELRLRSNLYCLESKKYLILTRNFFLNLKVILLKSSEFNVKANSIFQNFVLDIIKCDFPENKFNEIMNKYINELNGEELYLLLRRIRLFEYFALSKNEENIDWRIELLNENLCKRYNIKYNGNEYNLKPFSLTKLPKNFLHLGKEPYNFCREIETSEKEYVISLHDGTLIDRPQHYEGSKDDMHLVMMLNSAHSRTILVFRQRFHPEVHLLLVPSVYLNLLGNEDIGFQNGTELFLSEERLNTLTDDFLSGEIIRHIHYVSSSASIVKPTK